jgi:hypothetical protein
MMQSAKKTRVSMLASRLQRHKKHDRKARLKFSSFSYTARKLGLGK